MSQCKHYSDPDMPCRDLGYCIHANRAAASDEKAGEFSSAVFFLESAAVGNDANWTEARSRVLALYTEALRENAELRKHLHAAEAIGDFSEELRDRRSLQERADIADKLAARLQNAEALSEGRRVALESELQTNTELRVSDAANYARWSGENAVLRESNGQRLEGIVRLRTENADLRRQLAECEKVVGDYEATVRAIRAEQAEALKDVGRLREFAEFIFKSPWQGCDVDGGDAQDKAEALGLIVKVPADEAVKDEYDADEMFAPVWSAAAMALSGKEDGGSNPVSRERHPEATCEKCRGPNVWSWHAPSPLWNAVMRDPITGDDRYNIVCPPCFAELAREVIGRAVWCFKPHDMDVRPLWKDSDGREWDEKECLWAAPDTAPHEHRCVENASSLLGGVGVCAKRGFHLCPCGATWNLGEGATEGWTLPTTEPAPEQKCNQKGCKDTPVMVVRVTFLEKEQEPFALSYCKSHGVFLAEYLPTISVTPLKIERLPLI